LSYAAISRAHSGMYHLGYDRTEERLSRAKAAVDKALELQPKLPEAHMAFAWYHYWCHQDYERALEELAMAERGLPNNARTLELAAWIWRRQGKFEAAANRLKRAFELSPQDANLALEIGLTYKFLRRYAEVDRYMDLSISLAPDRRSPYRRKAYNYVSWLGDTKRAREVLEKMPGESRDVQEQSLRLWRLERNYEAILDFSLSDSRQIIWEMDYVWTPALLAARTYHFMGETELAHASYDSARSILEKELDAHPDDNRIHIALGFAYAGLGREEEAVREGKRAVELYPVSKDKVDGPNVVQDLAVIYTMVGEYDSALDEIEYLLSIPSYCSVQDLRLDPIWDPLRDHLRFQQILREY
jgi:tetratricopeptide (TPR) repeat protein